MAFAKKSKRTDKENLANSLDSGWIHQQVGDYAGAAIFYERMLAIRENLYGPDHTNAADSLKDLAGVYHSL